MLPRNDGDAIEGDADVGCGGVDAVVVCEGGGKNGQDEMLEIGVFEESRRTRWRSGVGDR